MKFFSLFKSNDVVYLGNFGKKGKIRGSQIKKTQSIYDYLSYNGLKVVKVNTESFKSWFAPLVLIRFIYYLFVSKNIIISLNKNGLKFANYFFLRAVNIFKRKKPIFITIGGWLPEFLSEHKGLSKYLMDYDTVYVQANEIKSKLELSGFKNIKNMHNFSVYDPSLLKAFEKRIYSIDYSEKRLTKVVFFAVIRKEKGLEIIVDAITRLNGKLNDHKFSLDIIGPVLKNYEEEFSRILRGNSSICNYKGEIYNQEEIFQVLNDYDIMAFPTFHEGEGFPTAIVESFISGIPVIASDWKYNSEIIRHGDNGLLFETNNIEDLISQLEWIYINKKELNRMRLQCLKEAEKYSREIILEPLLRQLKAN